MQRSSCRSSRLALLLVTSAIAGSATLSTLPACPTVERGRRSLSGSSDDTVQVRFTNRARYPVELSWVDFQGKESQHHKISPGETTERNTFPGHLFRARQAQSGILLMEHETNHRALQRVLIANCASADSQEFEQVPEFEPINVERTLGLVHNQSARCEPPGKSSQWSCVRKLPQGKQHLPKELFGFQTADVLDTDPACTRERKIYDHTDDGYSNLEHRMGVQRVTEGPGYLKMSLNPELFALLTQWAAKHSDFWKGEKPYSRAAFDNAESIGGCYANTHAFPFAILNMDHFPSIREAIVTFMQEVLEWWTNRRLEHTSTYGMRIYRRDAMLVNHVDREDTHIASAVIQVFQDCDDDGGWPLEVVGEDGLVREVYLQPGEMVLYEGARLLHGRPMRFKGNHFGNIFSHFKPSRDYDDL